MAGKRTDDIVLGPSLVSQIPAALFAASVGYLAAAPSTITSVLNADILTPLGGVGEINQVKIQGVLLLLLALIFLRIVNVLAFNVYRITNNEVIQRSGIIPRTRHVKLKDIRMTEVVRWPLISMGSVVIATAGTGEDDLQFTRLRHPRKVKAMIDQAERDWWEARGESSDKKKLS